MTSTPHSVDVASPRTAGTAGTAPLALLASVAASLVALAAGCENDVGGATPRTLPTAELVCPDHVDVGAEFVIDGSGSTADGDVFPDVTLTLVENLGGGIHEPVHELKHSFTVAADAVVTAALELKNDAGLDAAARCRFVVGDPFVVDEPPPPPPPPVTDDDDPSTHVPGTPVNLTGTWALVGYDAMRVSTLGLTTDEQCAPAPTVALVSLSQVARHVTMNVKTCAITMPAVDTLIGAQISSMSTGAVRALPSLAVEFDLAYGEVGDAFIAVQAPRGQVTGADVTDGETLPTSSSDPRVRDADGDGAPGATMTTVDAAGALVDLHNVVVRRTVRALSGVVVSNDEIDGSAPGSLEVDSETALLDDWADWLTPQAVGDPSTFMMVRTTAASCDALDVDALPAPPPPDFGDCFVYGN